MREINLPELIASDIIFEHQSRTAHPEGITVAVSLFNYARFVQECLDSIFAQTHLHIDLIVVDDHSQRDDSVKVTLDWMRAHKDRFDRVLLLRHVNNQGLAEARNTAFRAARNKLVFVIDADNIIYPRALSRLFEVMKDFEFDAAYTQLEFFGDEKKIGYADIWSKEGFKQGNYVDAMALVSKRAWLEVNGYTHLEGGWEDFDFWCKFVDKGMKAAYVPEILCRYRVHGSSMLRTETNVATESLKVELTMRHPWLRLV